jgi:hypothetical protein
MRVPNPGPWSFRAVLIFCAINVQLASGHQDASRAVVVTVESLGLDVKVDRVSDPPVCPATRC